MNTPIRIPGVLSNLLLFAAMSAETAADSASIRMLKVYPVSTQTCVATSISLPTGQALSGLTWYANDAQVSFPLVVLLEGIAGKAPNLDDAALILAEVSGPSLAWGSLSLNTPVISSTGIIDVVFVYPEHDEITALGSGGGPGIGVLEAAGAAAPYLSIDGYDWARFESGYRLAVEPVWASGKAAAVSLASLKESVDRSRLQQRPAARAASSTLAQLSIPYPNPFNPRTVIHLEMAEPGRARLAIYDVRGRLVTTLLDGVQPAGPQDIVWKGVDGRGKTVASGTYFVLLEALGEKQRQKLTLLR